MSAIVGGSVKPSGTLSPLGCARASPNASPSASASACPPLTHPARSTFTSAHALAFARFHASAQGTSNCCTSLSASITALFACGHPSNHPHHPRFDARGVSRPAMSRSFIHMHLDMPIPCLPRPFGAPSTVYFVLIRAQTFICAIVLPSPATNKHFNQNSYGNLDPKPANQTCPGCPRPSRDISFQAHSSEC